MKRLLTNAGCIALLLSIGIRVPGRAALPQQYQYQLTSTISAYYPAPYLHPADIWAEWIRLPRRSRRRRPPVWPRHLTKKQRRQLRRLRRRHLHRLRCHRRRCLRLLRQIEAQAATPESVPQKRRRRRRRKALAFQSGQEQVVLKQAESVADHQASDPLATPSVGEAETDPAGTPAEVDVSPALPTSDLPKPPAAVEPASTPRYGRKDVEISERRTYHAELETCLLCGTPLEKCDHLSWRKTVQTLDQNMFVGSRGSYCPHHPETIYLSASAARLSLPDSTYGLDVLVRIGYLRDYARWTPPRIRQSLPAHIKISERHIFNLYKDYLALLACAERLDVDKLRDAVRQYGGLILSIDGLEPEGGQPQLWVVREVLTDTLIAVGWIPRVDEDTLKAFLKPVADLDLPILSTLSDKQSALIKALEVTWKDVPHQYCQAHYLSNAVDPLYKADEHMKTQLRKQVRAGAGATMREVQAQAKRNASSDDPSSIVTGMTAHPPAELAGLKDEATATVIVEHTATSSAPNTTCSAPQTSPPPDVIVRKRQPSRAKKSRSSTTAPSNQSPPAPVSDRQARIDKLVVAYAGRLRNVLSRSGRKPFRLAGLRLYADLLDLLSSLEVSLTYLSDEPRLTCFADAIRQALSDFEEDFVWLAEGYSWVLDIADILDAPLPQPPSTNKDEASPQTTDASTVKTELDAYLQRLQARTDLSAPLISFRAHLIALTGRYAPGLFHCYHIPGLPRTNNDLESLFGAVRRRTLCTVGPYRAQQLLHDYGAWLLFETITDEHRQLERLRRVSLDDFRRERQRMLQHQESRTADRRFRRQPKAYLASCEAEAVAIARLE